MALPSQATHILIVDDEPSIRFVLQDALEREGYQVSVAERPSQALQLARQTAFDLALLDLQMPEMDGLSLLANLRSQSPDLMIIILTAHATVETAVRALRFGAYDYLYKPVEIAELRRSVGAGLEKRRQEIGQRNLLEQLGRNLTNNQVEAKTAGRPPSAPETQKNSAPAGSATLLQVGPLTLDTIRHTACLSGRTDLSLSSSEFTLLAYLAEKHPQVVPAQELAAKIFPYQTDPWKASDLIRYHIYHIRKKISRAGGSPAILRTVRGVGHSLSIENNERK